MELLIEHHAELEAKDIAGNTALILAAFYGHKDVVELLIEHHANLEAKDMKA